MIYLLSVMDKISNVTGAMAIVGSIAYILSVILTFVVFDAGARSLEDEVVALITKTKKTLFLTTLITTGLHCVIPSQDSLMKSYLMLEGSKIVNAENSTKFANEVGYKVDNLINVIDNRLNKPAEQTSEK